MALQAIAGSKYYIGTRVALPNDLHVDLADFAPQETEWLQINGWTNAGALGDTREAISQNYIDADRTETIGGTLNSAEQQNVFAPDYSDPGQNRLRQAVAECSNFAYKIEWGAGCAVTGPVTISVAAPGVVTFPGGHGLKDGSPVIFTVTGGTMPTGLVAGTLYYANPTGPTTFTVSATPGGAAIATTAAGTGTPVITATAQPAGRTVMFYGIALSASENGGEANTAQMATHSIKPNTNLVRV